MLTFTVDSTKIIAISLWIIQQGFSFKFFSKFQYTSPILLVHITLRKHLVALIL